MKYVILSGGNPPKKQILAEHADDADMLIGVDGAADVLDVHGIVPGVLIGDFDTAEEKSVASLKAQGAKVIRLQPRKNETDTEAAVDYALENGATKIVLLGALGSRIDHALSNIMMLVRAHRAGVPAILLDDYNELQVANTTFKLHGNPGQCISILPLTADLTVSAQGLEYPLDELVLPFGSSRGISNVMKSNTAILKISGGYALIVKTALA